MFETFISTDELAQIITRSDLLIVDCRSVLADPEAGQKMYASDHLPGAVFCDLNKQMSSKPTPTSSRHPLPNILAFRALLGNWGVTPSTQVVCYDVDSGSMAAGRLWWLLKISGHKAVAVLNGGYPAWISENRPTESTLPAARTSVKNEYSFNSEMYLSTEQIEKLHKNPEWLLLDARGPVRYSGLEEIIDPVGGHIPGAVNLPYAGLLDGVGKIQSPEVLRGIFARLLTDKDLSRTGVYCGSGVTSVVLVLAMESIGLQGAKVYPGSWSEWIREGRHPLAAGNKA